MPDPKYGLDILIILMDEDTLSKVSEQLSFDDSDFESGDSAPVPSSPATPLSKAAILAGLETFLQEVCPTGKTVISVGGPTRYILN